MPPQKPKVLPRVTYSPPREGGAGRGDYFDMSRGASYASNEGYAGQYGGSGGMPPLNSPPQQDPPPQVGPVMGPGLGAVDWDMVRQVQASAGMSPGMLSVMGANQIGDGEQDSTPSWMTSASGPVSYNPQQRAQDVAGGAPQYVQDAFERYYQQNPNGAEVTYPNRAGGVADGAIINRNVPQPTGDTRGEAIAERQADVVSQEQTDIARTQDAVNKNQRLTEEARNTGNDRELARLQAEWDRIAPKAAKYGITAERLVNSYMQPGNSAAESSMDRALGRAIADDTWANAATIAFGRPPNQVEWDEHWRAMNRGGRDPLEGHSEAINSIKARMEEIERENQQEAYAQYQAWLNSQ